MAELFPLGRMNAALKSLPLVVWHHRVLGSFWALCGFIPAASAFRDSSWREAPIWIALFVAGAFAATAAGFISGRTWARRTMSVLLILSALFFADMLLMSGWVGNRQGVWEMVGALGLVTYTQLFLVISAVYHPEGNRDNRTA